MVGVGIVDHDVHPGLAGVLSVAAIVIVALGAEHHHAAAMRELGMLDRAVLALVHGVALEAERIAEKVDRRMRIPVAQHGVDVLRGVGHSSVLSFSGTNV